MTAGIFELAVVMLIASVLGVVAKFFRQPVILAYLATGAVLAYFGWTKAMEQEMFQVFSDLGIMFLLFLVGLEISYDSLRLVGKSALILGFGQVLLTFAVGYGMATLFGFSSVHAAYIAFALTISSTVIVVKLLSERRELHSLAGRLAVGILVVQDFSVILLLVFLSGFASPEGFSPMSLAKTVTIAVSLFVFMLWAGRKLMPLFISRVAHSHELLFLISLAWVFLLAAFMQKIGFSIEIAGFLAGISLANASEHFQIAGRVRPLRDFFVLIFFVLLGSSVASVNFGALSWPIVAFSLFVLIGNPLIVLTIMGVMGYRRRTAFLTGVSIAQISEFSLVLAALGKEIGHVDDAVVSLITAVGVITITMSSYLITHSDQIFRRIHRPLKLFERRVTNENGLEHTGRTRPVILIGAHRTGQAIAMSLPKKSLLIVDFDPRVIGEMRAAGFACLFGDVSDPEIFEQASFDTAHLVINTSPDFEENIDITKVLVALPNHPRIIVRAEDEFQAERLYRAGADYVLLPNFTAGQYLGKTIAVDPDMGILDQLRKRDQHLLKNPRGFLTPPPVRGDHARRLLPRAMPAAAPPPPPPFRVRMAAAPPPPPSFRGVTTPPPPPPSASSPVMRRLRVYEA